jgi:DNA-binding transcriptional regulator YiaG
MHFSGSIWLLPLTKEMAPLGHTFWQEAARQFGRDYAKEHAAEFSTGNVKKVATGTDPLATIKKTASGSVPLAEMRIKNGLSQSQLAKAAGVPVRTIQQYEQGQKDIRRARAEYVISLSRALHCDPVRLLGH